MAIVRDAWKDLLLIPGRDAAESLSISERTPWGLTSPRGPIPCVRLGGRVLYSPEALRKWIAAQQEAGACHREASNGD